MVASSKTQTIRFVPPKFFGKLGSCNTIQYFMFKVLEVVAFLKENCSANVWNLKSCIGLYACCVIRRVAREGAMPPPPIPNVVPKIFRAIKVLMLKPKKYFGANQRHFLRNLSHQPLVEPDQSTMFYQLSMINQMLCT